VRGIENTSDSWEQAESQAPSKQEKSMPVDRF
jgi:hypothetical protein